MLYKNVFILKNRLDISLCLTSFKIVYANFIIKTNRRINFQILFCYLTCFLQFLCPSSGVIDCTFGTDTYYTGLTTASVQDQDGTAVSSWSCTLAVVLVPVPNVQSITPDDGQRNCTKHVKYNNKIWKFMRLLLFIIKLRLRCTVIWTLIDDVDTTNCIIFHNKWLDVSTNYKFIFC
jgi:hypothetical protein